jgi:hypothetical protein
MVGAQLSLELPTSHCQRAVVIKCPRPLLARCSCGTLLLHHGLNLFCPVPTWVTTMCTGVLSHRFTCASMNKKKRKKKKKKKSMYNYSSSWINLTQSHGLS